MRTPRLVFNIISFLFCFLSFSAYAENSSGGKIKLHVYLLKDRLNLQGTHPYNKLLKYVLQDVQDHFEILPAPIKRSAANFHNAKKACVFPTSKETQVLIHNNNPYMQQLIETVPIDYVSVRLYTKKGKPVIHSQSQLKGKIVGHLLGSVGERLLTEDNLTIRRVSDEGRLVRLLLADRVDVLLGHHPDTPMALDRLELGQVNYDPLLTLYKTAVTIVCHPFDGIDTVLEKINVRIREIRENGLAQKILGPHAEIVPLNREGVEFRN